MSLSTKIRVAVLRGGPSSEYDMSLKTGSFVLNNLPSKYEGVDVFIDKGGVWHVMGMPKSPDKVLRNVDVVFNALHAGASVRPSTGVDNQQVGDASFGNYVAQLQHILQTHKVPFTGSKPFASALSMNKALSKEIYLKNNIKTPQHSIIKKVDNLEQKINTIFSTFMMPVVVKPCKVSLSTGLLLVRNIVELRNVVEMVLNFDDTAIVEEFVDGKEISCGVIDDFRGKEFYTLLPTEINRKGETVGHITPGNISDKEKKIVEDYTQLAHKAFGLSNYSTSDFVVSPKRGVYILETNSLPGLTEESLVSKALQASGVQMPHFLDHILTMVLEGK
jgi:D-alanine-D-alanine ligase